MEFFRRASNSPGKLAILAGAFNPPTRAHLALARAALRTADEVLFVLPRVFPHKEYSGAAFEDRLRMIELALAGEPRYSIAAAAQSLFTDLARACRESYGGGVELFIVCGRDAAERAANWDYGAPNAFPRQLAEFRLLVAPRQGAYLPPPELRERIVELAMEPGFDLVSATEVRERIRSGRDWEHLTPESIAPLVREIYS